MVFEWLFGSAGDEGGAESPEKPTADRAAGENSADAEGASRKDDATSGDPGGTSTDVDKNSAQSNDGEGSGDEGTGGGTSRKQRKVPLSKSTRLKGYMTFTVASAINCYAAWESDLRNSSDADKSLVVPASRSQRNSAIAAALITIIISLFCIIVHFDRFTCLRKAWREAFKPGSRVELGILLFLLFWWLSFTIVNTSMRGIAGPGKGQYNLYFSTWVNMWTSIWTMDRWLTANGSASFKTFMDSWPNRSPGWLFMCILSSACLASVIDLFKHWEEESNKGPYKFAYEQFSNIDHGEWVFQIFVAAFTIPLAAIFSLIEVFRVSRIDIENTKSDRENMLEGLTLLLLVLLWIPVVIVSTTPGGSSSIVGNAYFFTWFTTVVVIETFVWWIRDWRKGIHDVVRMQEEEYERAKREVLRKHKQAKRAAAAEREGVRGG